MCLQNVTAVIFPRKEKAVREAEGRKEAHAPDRQCRDPAEGIYECVKVR